MENQVHKRNSLFAFILIFFCSCNNNEFDSPIKLRDRTDIIKEDSIDCNKKFSTNFTTYNDLTGLDSLLVISYSDTNFINEKSSEKIKILNKVLYTPNNLNRKIWSFGLMDSLNSIFSYKIVFLNNQIEYKLSNIKIGKESIMIGGELHSICSLKKYKLNNKTYTKIDIHL